MSPKMVAMETSANYTGSSASGMAHQSYPKVGGLSFCIRSSASHWPGLFLGEDVPWVKAISGERWSSEPSAADILSSWGMGVWPWRSRHTGSKMDHPLSSSDSFASHSKFAPSLMASLGLWIVSSGNWQEKGWWDKRQPLIVIWSQDSNRYAPFLPVLDSLYPWLVSVLV